MSTAVNYRPMSLAECHLGIDHLVRFFIRGRAESFADGVQSEDNGLRVTLHLRDVEFLACTNRNGGEIEVLDLTTSPPVPVPLSALDRRLLEIIDNPSFR